MTSYSFAREVERRGGEWERGGGGGGTERKEGRGIDREGEGDRQRRVD